jgi:hypothetical protein
MQCALLILTAIAISTATTDNSNFIPNRQHQQIALCIQTVVHQYFTRGRTVLVSMPIDEKPTGRSLSPKPYGNNRALVSFTLRKLHENVTWPLRLFPLTTPLDAGFETTHSYIIFIWPEVEDTDVLETINLLKTKRRLLYLKAQFVPRCKHFSSRLYKTISLWWNWHKSLLVLR